MLDREGNIALYLIDPQIRSSVISHFSDWMFQKNIYRAFFKVISKENFNEQKLDPSVVKMAIQEGYREYQQSDLKIIDDLFSGFSGISDNDRKFVLKIISEFIKERLYWKGLDLMASNKLEEAEPLLCKAVNFSLQAKRFTNLSDSQKILDLFEKKFPKDGKYIKSTLSLVNKNSLFKGYRRGDLVQICARPKAGKTTLMVQETAAFSSQSYHVVFASIGDNEQDDIAMKVCSYMTATPMEQVIQDFASQLGKNEEILKNIDAESYPSGSVAIGELLADCKQIHLVRPIDVLVVDYDANIMQPTDNMYESGGIIYSALKGFAQMNNCVVIVGSQPVKSAWRDEILEADSANESSKKQMHVDMMITIGVNPECSYLGTVNIPLMRRGTGSVISRVRFNFETAEIKELTPEEYSEALDNYLSSSGSNKNKGNKFSPVEFGEDRE